MTHCQSHQTEPVIPTDTPDLMTDEDEVMTAAQGAGLSESERAALLEAYCRHSAEGRRQVGHAVAAALTTAAEAIEAARDICRDGHGPNCVASPAYTHSAQLVRDLIPPPT